MELAKSRFNCVFENERNVGFETMNFRRFEKTMGGMDALDESVIPHLQKVYRPSSGFVHSRELSGNCACIVALLKCGPEPASAGSANWILQNEMNLVFATMLTVCHLIVGLRQKRHSRILVSIVNFRIVTTRREYPLTDAGAYFALIPESAC